MGMAVSFLFLAAATACGSDGAKKPAASSGQTSTSRPTDAAATTGAPRTAQPDIVLEDPGVQPRQPLLLHLRPGTTTSAALVSKAGIQLSVDGKPLPLGVLPNTRTVLTQQVDKVDSDGTIHYSVTLSDVAVIDTPGADPAVVEQIQSTLGQLKGLKGTGTLDVHGGGQTGSIDTGNVTNPLLKSTLDSVSSQFSNLTAPFPREAVGVGARWTAKRSATINGITMNTTTHHTLRARAGDHYEIDVAQEAAAPPGSAAIPNLPGGTSAAITSFTLHSTGKLAGELTRALPDASSSTGAGDGAFTITQGTESGSATEHLTLEFVLSPA